ncbi:hypothetical protein FNH22_29970 [Fulvivirga sp. M361]|uniref:hypothetical protein n=1 Tax=Fulvivirga sp. M361 TaxID=2594266 RepID=UPI00117AE5EA|nr:hypothetical protein [Fulvivirga sp. M361]TRX48000.1 hypothetical protein FNH22_29970 [Fulvivirga sp. M361]
MNKLLLLLLAILSIVSCNKADWQIKDEEETPEVLTVEKGDLNLSSLSKRYDTDIIQKLFDEAVDKDIRLKSIVNRIEKMDELKKDSLKEYHTYVATNQKYWTALDYYLSQINDTTLSQKLRPIVDTLKRNHENNVAGLKSLSSRIQANERTLVDQEIMMKILVTEPMMRNYQRNEMPDIKALESVKQGYDLLIQDMKSYTEWPKQNK